MFNVNYLLLFSYRINKVNSKILRLFQLISYQYIKILLFSGCVISFSQISCSCICIENIFYYLEILHVNGLKKPNLEVFNLSVQESLIKC